MNEIAQMVADKFHIPPETAQQIVTFLLEQVKGKLPEGLGSHIDGLMAGGSSAAEAEGGGGLLDSLKNVASGLMNKG